MAAGCLFTDGTYVLAGLQSKQETFQFSGFGGKPEESDECIVDTAIRETLEELLATEIPTSVSRDIMIHYIPRNQFKNGDYQVYVYDFLDLLDFLKIAAEFGLTSPLYEKYPTSLIDLILNRRNLESAEVKELALLPLKAHHAISQEFLSDLELLKSHSL